MQTNELHPSRGPRLSGLERRFQAARGGFSLIELVVAIGILVLMMALAGQVFTIAIDSTGQANSLIEVNQSIRLLEATLREDLRNIDPASSMMVISANPIAAYWTAEEKERDFDKDPTNGYVHEPDSEREDVLADGNPAPPHDLEHPRADVLMFFTSRPTTSTIYPSIESNLAQVVYGHAELGELNSLGVWATVPAAFLPPYPNGLYFEPPAETWHLARRSIVLVDAHEDSLDPAFAPGVDDLPNATPDEGANGPFQLSDGIFDVIVQDELTTGTLFFDVNVVAGAPAFPLLQRWARRSRMDLTPPPLHASRLGHYFIPKCASFKVEWGFSHPGVVGEVVWVDPADIAGSVLTQFANAVPPVVAPDPVFNEFAPPVGVGRFDPTDAATPDWSIGTTHMFLSHDFIPGGNPDNLDPFFPRVLRITVDINDRAGKFAKPFRHVMIIPVGN